MTLDPWPLSQQWTVYNDQAVCVLGTLVIDSETFLALQYDSNLVEFINAADAVRDFVFAATQTQATNELVQA